MEWTKKKYNENYTYCECAVGDSLVAGGMRVGKERETDVEVDMPWIEDKYLQWFGENKTSYTIKGSCSSLVAPFTPHQGEPQSDTEALPALARNPALPPSQPLSSLKFT